MDPAVKSRDDGMEIIGRVNSPYKEKFAIPRQPGLVKQVQGRIEMLSPYNHPDSVRDLEQFSHIWVVFIFHKTQAKSWKPLVRPPRLGGNVKTGVFATRSTHRPNPVGLSVVKLDGITQSGEGLYLEISGLDLLDQTPVIDIKPYIPYSDSLPNASAGFAACTPVANMAVIFSDRAQSALAHIEREHPRLENIVRDVLAQDPRPAYKNRNSEKQSYGMQLYDLNITWEVQNDTCRVIDIQNVQLES